MSNNLRIVVQGFLPIVLCLSCSGQDPAPIFPDVAQVTDGSADLLPGDLQSDDLSGSVDLSQETNDAPEVIELKLFGEPCAEATECLSGWCVEFMGETVCSEVCVTECSKDGWTCEQVDTGPDKQWVCFSDTARLCLPCQASIDCATTPQSLDVCVVFPSETWTGIEATFCGVACETDDDCPKNLEDDAPPDIDFICRDVETVEGVASRQCVPLEGLCTCSQQAIVWGLKALCTVENEYGTCPDDRQCTEDGLEPCKALKPAPEVADGKDNDCNGIADDGLCICGDGSCVGICGETDNNCAIDCHNCDNGTCDLGEGPCNCPQDCCGICGDNKCASYDINGEHCCPEDADNCPDDCAGFACGNGECEKGEDPFYCPQDCEKFFCGNGICEPGETIGDDKECLLDCEAACGDCQCEGGEDFFSCPIDCGFCGDGYCMADTCDALPEDLLSCFVDCCIPDCETECGPDGCGGLCSNCNDGNICTDDSCDENDACVHDLQNFWCLIEDVCLPSGTQEPGNPCASCDPDPGEPDTADQWTSSDDGAYCGPGKICWQGLCCNHGSHCEGKECGDDLCGGDCGTCGMGLFCAEGLCVECDDGNVLDWDGCTDGLISEFRINSTTEGEQRWSTATLLPDGGFVVAWRYYGIDWQVPGIGFRRFLQDGAAFGLDGLASIVDTGAPNIYSSFGPSVVSLPDGRLVVVWNDFDGTGTAKDVLIRFQDSDGVWWGDPFPVYTEGTGTLYQPRLAAAPDGAVLVLWTAEGLEDAEGDIYARLYSAQAAPITAAIHLSGSDSQKKQWQPAVAALSGGGYATVWSGLDTEGISRIRFRLVNADGTPDASILPVSPPGFGHSRTPRAVGLTDGRFVVIWVAEDLDNDGPSPGDGDGYGVFARLFLADGTPDGDPVQVNLDGGGDQGQPDVAALPDARFVVVWATETTQGHVEVQARILDPDGAASPIDVMNPVSMYPGVSGDQGWRAPAVASSSDGSFLVTWEIEEQDGDAHGIFAQRYEANGSKRYL